MPCKLVIARLFLKQGRAKGKRREPFTIKLLYESPHYTQSMTPGVDTRSGTFGTTVTRENGSGVSAGEVTGFRKFGKG